MKIKRLRPRYMVLAVSVCALAVYAQLSEPKEPKYPVDRYFQAMEGDLRTIFMNKGVLEQEIDRGMVFYFSMSIQRVNKRSTNDWKTISDVWKLVNPRRPTLSTQVRLIKRDRIIQSGIFDKGLSPEPSFLEQKLEAGDMVIILHEGDY